MLNKYCQWIIECMAYTIAEPDLVSVCMYAPQTFEACTDRTESNNETKEHSISVVLCTAWKLMSCDYQFLIQCFQ